ncbi:hypothetical protein D9756_003597 [Leucocoprinus leucothites]|uniref:Uncharacterized protein n=1 Tax=Leucocoprinus leucothites TaxID=201217 RepID=A0A8H5G6Q2_9AGAR|nr:hypothetical protein D9756_003597 [Leucoagaricus leucothites]
MRFSTLQSGFVFLSLLLSLTTALPEPSVDLRAVNNVSNTTDNVEVLPDGYVPPGYKPTVNIRDEGTPEALDNKQPDGLVSRDSDRQLIHNPENKPAVPMADETKNNTLQPRGRVKAAEVVIKGILDIVQEILHGIKSDKKGREEFTKSTVSNGLERYPEFNWVVVHPQHEIDFDGVKNEDWGHQHHEYDIKIGGTIGYEIYWFRSGKFKRFGDGGFINASLFLSLALKIKC